MVLSCFRRIKQNISVLLWGENQRKASHMELVTVLGDEAAKAKTNAGTRSTRQAMQGYKTTP